MTKLSQILLYKAAVINKNTSNRFLLYFFSLQQQCILFELIASN